MLKAALERYGVQVVTTRATKDKDLGLESRGRKAAGCDLFLSLHSNGIGSGVSAADYPLACCCVAGTADVLGMDLAETVQRVMQTDQRARIIKKKGTDGDWYGVLHGADIHPRKLRRYQPGCGMGSYTHKEAQELREG